MGMNKVKQGSNMYQFLNDNGNRGYTWNVIKGKCPHNCSYCYMNRYPQSELHFDEKELKTNLGSGNFIFVGSSCDMWADGIDAFWLDSIMKHCCEYQNEYLFQSKNPMRFVSYQYAHPIKAIYGVTIESNRYYPDISKAPSPEERYEAMLLLNHPKMVSIEPIMDFDPYILGGWLRNLMPNFVSIGADSGNNHLPEPSSAKIKAFIEAIKDVTEVKLKNNLGRLLRPSQRGETLCWVDKGLL